MDLVADVGNTNTHLALFEGEALVRAGSFPNRDADAFRAAAAGWLEGAAPARLAAASVNPAGLEGLRALGATLGLEARVLGQDLPARIEVLPNTETLGADRLANALWAARTYPEHACTVIDAGTAITIDTVSVDNRYLGGTIGPGLTMCARALAERTARLPEVDLREPRAELPTCLATTTRGALEAALLWGAIGGIGRVIQEVAKAIGECPVIVMTGGDAPVLQPHLEWWCLHVEHVTLLGVRHALAEA